MKLNYSKILSITFISFLLSLMYNHFNPNGLSFVREERKLDWENDSVTSLNKIDSIISDASLSQVKLSDSVVIGKKDEPLESFKKPTAIKLDFTYKLFKQGIQFIDARSKEEFAEGHIKGAINIPFYGSENYLSVINSLNKKEIVITYCSGADCDISILSGDELFKMGFKRVYVFIGGFDEWTKSNYPISKN